MANIDAQLGLRPVQSKYGTVPQIRSYTRSSTGVIYEGALLYQGILGPAVYNGTTAAQSYNILGVAAHYVGAAETEMKVFDDVDQIYEIQADANAITTVVIAREQAGKYCNLVSNTAGNSLTGQSKCELDTSEVTGVQAAHDVVQLIALSTDSANDVTLANEKWHVKINPKEQIYTNGRTIHTSQGGCQFE